MEAQNLTRTKHDNGRTICLILCINCIFRDLLCSSLLRVTQNACLCFRRRRHYVFRLSVRPSVRLKPEIPSFDLYMGPLVPPTNRDYRPFYGMSDDPSVRLERFPGICGRTHGVNGLKFYMLMYFDHLQYWFVYGNGLMIFLILALFWLSETGLIWGFRAFSGERMEEMAWNFACWCILPPSELLSLWQHSVDFSNFGTILT